MFVVTVQHKEAMWIMCYGPFDDYLDANAFAHVKQSAYALRVNVLTVASPNE